MVRYVIAAILLALSLPAWAQNAQPVIPILPGCNMTPANYSGTVTNGSAVLIPAAPSGMTRTGIFIELLTASSTLGINPMGGTASTSAAGNIVISTSGTAPQNFGYINTAGLGFTPQGAITAIASGNVTVSAWACPQ